MKKLEQTMKKSELRINNDQTTGHIKGIKVYTKHR